MDREKKLLRYLLSILLALPFFGGSGFSQDISHIASVSEGIIAPLRITSDLSSNIYVSDAVNGTVSRYDEAGNLLEQITSLESPVSLAVRSDGKLFIGDGITGNIYCYDSQKGATVFYKGAIFPSSMVFGSDNTLYISDSKQGLVLVLDISGTLVGTVGEGILDFPTGIAYDNASKRIYVGEHGGKGGSFSTVVKVWVFDVAGNLLGSFGSHGSGEGQFYRIQGLAAGKCGDIYVVDPFQARVSIFDKDGNFKSSYGEFGLSEGDLNVPMDIAFDSQNRMIVSSLNNGILEIFELNDKLPAGTLRTESTMLCQDESALLEFSFTGTAPWTFSYTIDGLNPVEVVTSENPYMLSTDVPGLYEISSLSDAAFTGECFSGSAEVILSDPSPTAHISGDETICEGERASITIDFTGTPPWYFSYTLNNENPVELVTTSNPYILETGIAGLYKLASVRGGACDGTALTGSAEITVIEAPTSEFAAGNEVVLLRPGETVSLDVNLTGKSPWSITYTVDLGDSTTISDILESPFTLVDDRPGSYEIMEVSDSRCAGGFPAASFPDVVAVPADGLPTASIEDAEYSVCRGGFVPIEVIFTGEPPWTFTYTDDTGSNTVYRTLDNPYIINAADAGIYKIIALNDSRFDGVDFTGEARVSVAGKPVADFSFSSDQLDVTFGNLSLNAESYMWNFGDGSNSVLQDPVHSYSTPGEYTVTLRASNGSCPDSIIVKNLTLTATSDREVSEDESLKVYPNPSRGILNIEFGFSPETRSQLEVFNQLGMIVYKRYIESGEKTSLIDLSKFEGGIYFIKVSSGGISYIRQVVLSGDVPE